MTNCNCECICEEMEYQGECECCFCDLDNYQEDNVPYVPSQQEIEQGLAEARAVIEFYQNKINMLDRQDSDYEWKLNRFEFLITLHRQNIVELENQL